MKYKDQLILTGKISEIGEFLTTNIKDSYRAGIELTFGTKITNEFRWDGNLNLSSNKILNFTEQDVDMYDAEWNWIDSKENFMKKTDIAYSPNIVANSMFSYKLNDVEIGFNSNFVGRQFFDNTSSIDRSIPAYLVNNLIVSNTIKSKFFKEVKLNLMINNLFNAKYHTSAYTWYSYYLDNKRVTESRIFPQAGRNFLASVNFRF